MVMATEYKREMSTTVALCTGFDPMIIHFSVGINDTSTMHLHVYWYEHPNWCMFSPGFEPGTLSLRATRLASYHYAEGTPFRVIDNLNLLPLTWLVVTLSHRAMAMATEYYWEIGPNFWVSALTTEPLGWQELVVTICVRFGPELNRGLQD